MLENFLFLVFYGLVFKKVFFGDYSDFDWFFFVRDVKDKIKEVILIIVILMVRWMLFFFILCYKNIDSLLKFCL